jgi:hypothetical protein
MMMWFFPGSGMQFKLPAANHRNTTKSTYVMFALKPAFIYSVSQLLEASRFGHFVLRSMQNGSTEANAATVTQKQLISSTARAVTPAY